MAEAAPLLRSKDFGSTSAAQQLQRSWGCHKKRDCFPELFSGFLQVEQIRATCWPKRYPSCFRQTCAISWLGDVCAAPPDQLGNLFFPRHVSVVAARVACPFV